MPAYYNEFDPKAAKWLEMLILEGDIAPGHVDTRSIEDVRPGDLAGYTQCHFFAGIGGWSLALRMAGWPDDRAVWTGSCPCQPFSQAGKGGGFDDSRHLWPAFGWLIDQCAPPVIFGEQVASPAGLAWIDVVLADLESSDYACAAADICAAGVGAPHIRQRLYWMAHHHLGREQHSQRNSQPEARGEEGPRGNDVSRCGIDGRMADDGLERRRQIGEDVRRCSERSPAQGVEQRPLHGCSIELGDPGSSRSGRNAGEVLGKEGGTERRVRGESDESVPAGSIDQLGHSECDRLRISGWPSTDVVNKSGYWSVLDWVNCRDGKRRPVEPGTFPLAHGVPGRVGLLRGYGNAIVPQVAAAFIGAYLDANDQT